ncbi:MAG: 3-deoxy-manno-octulosonate cytidylyltransferase (CMP-KDO synthetase) [Phenylobacterium sp.]|jgi:3-deoxy-manno-octulosonate cytidylyltransferase (CMP-KDO synthetase)
MVAAAEPDFVVIIPARFASSRLPGKPLADIGGKPMIQWVYEKSVASGAKQVIVATDDAKVEQVVNDFGGEVCMTSTEHNSGTERLAEVIKLKGLKADTIIVNVQGDEPLIPPENIRQVADNLSRSSKAKMATLSVKIHSVEEAFNPNAVKVVCDKDGYALYFSRSTVPYDRNHFLNNEDISTIGDFYQRHIGIYAYRAGFIEQYIQWPDSPLEHIEMLEQLRVLWHGEKIHVEEAHVAPHAGVDTPGDLAVVRNIVAQSQQNKIAQK